MRFEPAMQMPPAEPPMEPKLGAAAEKLRALTAEHQRLQVLVGELLAANQALRFKVNELEKRAEDAERGLARASAYAAWLLP